MTDRILKLIQAYVKDETASEEARLFMINYWATEALKGNEMPSVEEWPVPGDAGGYAPFIWHTMVELYAEIKR